MNGLVGPWTTVGHRVRVVEDTPQAETMMRHVAILCVAFLLSGDVLASPQQALAVAHANCKRIAPESQVQVRYLDATHLPPKDLIEAFQVISGHCNGLSTESDINLPTFLEGGVFRVNLLDYGWKMETWEKLAEDEPYFHAEVEQEYGYIVNGVWKTTETRRERAHVGGQPAIDLISMTQSQVPIVRVDWFFSQTAIQYKRKAGYYDFLGIKNQKDFETLVGFDKKLNDASKRKELLEAVSDSGVTQEPRRIARFPAVDGMGYWKTFDQFSETARDKKNPLRVLDDENFDFDASEEYGGLPNHLWVTGLFAKDGTRQDSVPDAIAHDKTTASNDGRLHVNLACIRCHGPHDGIQPMGEWARGLFRLQGPLRLQSPSYEVIKDLRQKYLRDLKVPMELDRQAYVRALFQATGMNPVKYTQAYAAMWSRFEDEKVAPERAATEWGVDRQTMTTKLDAHLKSTGSLDNVLAKLYDGGSIKRRQYEEVYQLGAQIIGGGK